MDLKLIKTAEEPTRLDLRHPGTGEMLKYGKDNEKTMHLLLHGRDSETYRKHQRKLLDKRLKEQQKFRQVKMTASQLEDEAIDQLAIVTVGGAVFLDGKEVVLDSGKAADLYREYPWIKEQAEMHIEDRSNFLSD